MQKVLLSSLKEENLITYFGWRNDPKVYKWCRQFEPLQWSDHLNWFDRVTKSKTEKMYEIQSRDNTLLKVVGVCGLTSIDYINSRAEFSLYVGPENFGLGYGKMALLELFKKGFNELNLNLIWGEMFDGNRAEKTFLKLGMKKEGTRRDFYYRDGCYIDAHLFSVTRDEFFNNSKP